MHSLTLIVLIALAPPQERNPRPPAVVPVPLADVSIADEFWSPRIKATREQTLPHSFKMCEETGRLRNFDKAAGRLAGAHEGYFFNDSDVYKLLEATAYALTIERDRELERLLDETIARIAAAQRPDGYLNTYFALTPQEERWTNLKVRHELYCAGHLLEAGVAHFQATGKRTLLDVATRFADHLDQVFGPGKRADVCGHEEIELALLKLAGVTGEARYFRLAEFFLDQRGRADRGPLYGEYCQDHRPIREQREAVGHAVRAMYLYSAMTDVTAITGATGYREALDALWPDVVEKKMYVTGGIGSSAQNEGFTPAYDLPNDSAYAETCAGIGLVFWAERMNRLHRDARYADILERALYNGVLAGVALDGRSFFYENPLGSRGTHHREPWYACACCPPNLARVLLSLGGRVYARTDDAVYVNLFVGSRAQIRLADTTVEIAQTTRYPWDGRVRITVQPAAVRSFDLYVRIPGWCATATIQVNGEAIAEPSVGRGYCRLRRAWQAGDVVELDLPMPVRRIAADARVTADRGRVALQRGPLVYCIEAADNGDRVRQLALPRESPLTFEHRPELLGGVTVLHGNALVAQREGGPAQTGGPYPAAPAAERIEFTAIPYYAWDNRAPGAMVVWLPESLTLADPAPAPGITPSASHCYSSDTVAALHDRLEPVNSSDQAIPRFTWWDHRGTSEWVRYDFTGVQHLASCDVYWFDDAGRGGGCRPPAAWKLLYLKDDAWEEVANASGYPALPDRFNRVTFAPVETKGLKLEVQLQPEMSGGILEWKVGQ